MAYDYYPFGLTWHNPAAADTPEGRHDHAYQDKEFQWNEFGAGAGMALYDFHARMYDAATATWSVPDPAEQFANPYLAMGNNPVTMIDPDGKWVHIVIGAAIGAVVKVGIAAAQGNLNGQNWWKYAAVGAIAGGLAAATGGGTASVMGGGSFSAGFVGSASAATSTGFIAGATIGMAAGFTGGFVNGVGSGWITGQSFSNSMKMGLEQGVIGGVIGFGTGGIGGSIKAARDFRNPLTGKVIQYKLGIDGELTASTDGIGTISIGEDGYTLSNSSGHDVWYKPENSSIAEKLQSGYGIKSDIDGVTHYLHLGKVYKVTDIIGTIRATTQGIATGNPVIWPIPGEVNALIGGGWLSTPPDPGWYDIFNHSGGWIKY